LFEYKKLYLFTYNKRSALSRKELVMNNQSDNTMAEVPFSGLFSSEFSANPFPVLAQMRSMGALVPVSLPMGQEANRRVWMVTRWEEAVQVFKDHKRFTVEGSLVDRNSFVRRRAEHSSEEPILFGKSMISVDEPDHMRLRGLVSKAFTPKYIQSLRPRIQQLADELLDAVQDQGSMDIVHDYGYPLPINVISEMLGVPEENREQIRVWSEALASGGMNLDEENRSKVQAFSDYTVQLVADKRRHPQDDLISQLIQIEEEGDRLDESELLSMISLLIFAGHETTSNLIGISTLMLLDHPDQLAKLKADLSLIPMAVEELLRYNGPVTMPVPRFATEEVEIGGQRVQRGDLLVVLLTSTNRDEGQFTQSDELDIARQLNRHIAFGQGIHVCLGAPLARLEGDIAFTTLLRRMPNLRLSVPRETLSWRISSNLCGLTSLPVAF
jgi:cytochrome P450